MYFKGDDSLSEEYFKCCMKVGVAEKDIVKEVLVEAGQIYRDNGNKFNEKSINLIERFIVKCALRDK